MIQLIALEGPDAFLLRELDRDDGYFPINLPGEFHIAGLQIRVESLLNREHQVALHPTVEILSITPLTGP